MSSFTVYTPENAPAGSADTLGAAKARYGFVPNLYGVLAESPAAVAAYIQLTDQFTSSSLTPVEQQIVAVAASMVNDCKYCVAAHSTVATMVKMPEPVLAALRAGQRLPDEKLEALRTLTIQAVKQRGWLSEDDLRPFYDAGYTKANVLDVIVGLALKTLSNFTNHIADTPVDAAFAAQAWQPAEKADDAV